MPKRQAVHWRAWQGTGHSPKPLQISDLGGHLWGSNSNKKREELPKIKHECKIPADFQQAVVQRLPWHFKEHGSFPRSHPGLRTGDLKAENTELKRL